MADTKGLSTEPASFAGGNMASWLPLAGIVLAWSVLISQVRHHWGGESYYNFGWFVPAMAVWLLLRNLSPVVGPAGSRQLSWPIWLGALAILVTTPFHALSEVNPFWRLPLWIQAIGVCTFSLAMLHQLYGWRGVRAGIFPLFFLSTMIPWPYRIELMIVQFLTGVVVSLSMSGLHFIGYPVELAGNSFVLGSLNIGVNEACSGIRSLQALFMVTLFLGSLFGQGWQRRLFAVLLLPFVVIVVNTGRAIFLALQVIENGQAAYDEWHDPAGYIAFGISMVLIYASIELLNIGSKGESQQSPLDATSLLRALRETRVSARIAWVAALPLVVFGSVESWFLYHESQRPAGREWRLILPDPSDTSVQIKEIHPQIEAALGYDYGHRFFKNIRGRLWCEVYYYGYTPENKLSSVSSYGHAPTICMEATGASMERQFEDLILPIEGGPSLSMRHYLFRLRDDASRLHVFWTVWERRNMDIENERLQSLDYRTQLVQLMKGRRDFSRKVLLLSLPGMANEEQARDTIRDLLKDWLVGMPDSTGSAPAEAGL